MKEKLQRLDGEFVCCDGEGMDLTRVWDSPDAGFAWNLFSCLYCGKIVKEMVWDNKGVSECAAGEHFRNKEEIFEARCQEVEPCPDCGPSYKILRDGILRCGKCKRVLLEE